MEDRTLKIMAQLVFWGFIVILVWRFGSHHNGKSPSSPIVYAQPCKTSEDWLSASNAKIEAINTVVSVSYGNNDHDDELLQAYADIATWAAVNTPYAPPAATMNALWGMRDGMYARVGRGAYIPEPTISAVETQYAIAQSTADAYCHWVLDTPVPTPTSFS